MKLIALDQEDLAIVSTHVQDSLVAIDDIIWRPAEKRLVIGLNRFDWEAAVGADGEFRRRRAALRFDRALCCKCKNIDRGNKSAVLNLLAVEFRETDPPAGILTLYFSGGAMLRVEVECLEAQLADLGPVWKTTLCPQHQEDQSDLRG